MAERKQKYMHLNRRTLFSPRAPVRTNMRLLNPMRASSSTCILLKYLKGPRERIEWRRMLSGGAVDVLDEEDTLDAMVVDE